MEDAARTALDDAMSALWLKFLPQMRERLARLDEANAAIAQGKLTEEIRTEANAAAHKLAGVLGTFGLHRGTELAREAERLSAGGINQDDHGLQTLERIVQELRAMIEGRQ